MKIDLIETPKHLGKKIDLFGWIDARRDHGKLIFFDLRDRSGKVQLVVTPENEELHKKAETLRPEWVIKASGEVKKRPQNMINEKEPCGKIEINVSKLEILSEAKTPPFDLSGDGYEIGEEMRMQYRYLDLRRARLMKNLIVRDKLILFIRNYLSNLGFVEIETPNLSKSTPEGARDYLVPSRLHPGNFYALPQSPQQYKQLLMAAGVEKYFQIARCFRDEDTRGDRQPEFTQLDLEVSFTTREEVIDLNEKLLIELVKKNYPEKIIQEIPFPRLSYKEAMEKYGIDRPDLRTDKNNPNLLSFCWIIDFPFFEITGEDKWTFTHNPFSAPMPEFMDDLLKQKNIGDIVAAQYDVVLNGFEIGGGSIRNHNPEALRAVFKIMGFSDERIEENFGHMLEAFSFGIPPHGGIAWGLDRLVTTLQNEPNIREVIAFPKTGDGRDLMMHAPSEVDPAQLAELGIEIKKSKKKK
ncbi:aspartate--tRNA ligase [Candidatus Giovannonibacteria bacterium]|nr:aspartate--tRNA ligase [Candidatus Giovannonibacteria bacterium]